MGRGSRPKVQLEVDVSSPRGVIANHDTSSPLALLINTLLELPTQSPAAAACSSRRALSLHE